MARRTRRTGRGRSDKSKRWSRRVARSSDAFDLERGVFTRPTPRAVARPLERSTRRKSDPFRSAMSMLTFYINRAGKNLPARRLRILQQAKDELRAQFHRPRRAG